MKKIITGILLVLFSTIGTSHGFSGTKKKVSWRKQKKILAQEQILQLHNGALLVRLKTRENAIDALRKIGNNAKADKIQSQQADLNQRIVNAFRYNFNFCQTYFFFSDYSDFVREKQFDSIAFLNNRLETDTLIKFDNKSFLTAEFDITEQDTSKYFDNYFFSQGENGNEIRKNYWGGPDMRFAALIIKSDLFIQLRRPFKYYVRTFDYWPMKRTPQKAVQRMNKKLHRFYKRKYQ